MKTTTALELVINLLEEFEVDDDHFNLFEAITIVQPLLEQLHDDYDNDEENME